MSVPDAAVDTSTTVARPRVSLVWRALIALVVLDAIGKLLIYGLYQPLYSPNADYFKHWQAAVRMLQGESPYYGASDLYLGFNYPLFTGWIFIYHGFLPADWSRVLWIFGNAAFVLGSLWMLVRWYCPEEPQREQHERPELFAARRNAHALWPVLVLVSLANFHPLLQSLRPANIEPLNLILLIGFGAAWLKRKDNVAGVVLAMATLTKLVPILMFVPILAARRWRVAVGFGSSLLLYAAVLAVTGEWRTEAFLYQDVLPKISHHYLGISYSIHKIVAYVFCPAALETAASYNRIAFIVNACLGLLFASLCSIMWFSPRKSHNLFIAFALTMIPLFSPLLEYHHFIWAAPAFYLQLREWIAGRVPGHIAFALLIGWLALGGVRVLNYLVLTNIGFPTLNLACPVSFVLTGISAWAFAYRGEAGSGTATNSNELSRL